MKKLILFSIIIALLWLTYDYFKGESIEVDESMTQQDALPVDKDVSEVVNEQANNQTENMIPESNELPEGQLFHEDAMIDLFTGLNHYAPCHTYFSDKDEDQEEIKNLNAQQSKYLEPFFTACEEEKNQFDLYSKNKIMSKLTVLGLQLKQQKEAFNIDSDSFLAYMNQADGYEMLIAFDFTNDYVRSQIIPEIKSLLEIKNHQILKLVVDEALMVMACKRGVDCSYVSGMMMNRCMDDENACGLSFQQYVDGHYLPGIKQEIMRTATYLSNHFGY